MLTTLPALHSMLVVNTGQLTNHRTPCSKLQNGFQIYLFQKLIVYTRNFLVKETN